MCYLAVVFVIFFCSNHVFLFLVCPERKKIIKSLSLSIIDVRMAVVAFTNLPRIGYVRL